MFKMADVGDGLCCIFSCADTTVQLDWGSQQGSQVAIEGWRNIVVHEGGYLRPEVFVLSHFHTDHYNGLLRAARTPGEFRLFRSLGVVLMAGLPDFPRKTDFYGALFAVNARVFGSESGHMEYDFRRTLYELSGNRRLEFARLFQGDHIFIGDARLQCVWPPRHIEDRHVGNRVVRALAKFGEALEQDEALRRVHEHLLESNFLAELESLKHPHDDYYAWEGLADADLSPPSKPVLEGNAALRFVANDLSLAFRQEDRLLSMGDADLAIPSIVEFLRTNQALDFHIFVAPHHGTHWKQNLHNLRAHFSLVSNGEGRARKYKRQFIDISRGGVLATYTHGDIALGL